MNETEAHTDAAGVEVGLCGVPLPDPPLDAAPPSPLLLPHPGDLGAQPPLEEHSDMPHAFAAVSRATGTDGERLDACGRTLLVPASAAEKVISMTAPSAATAAPAPSPEAVCELHRLLQGMAAAATGDGSSSGASPPPLLGRSPVGVVPACTPAAAAAAGHGAWTHPLPTPSPPAIGVALAHGDSPMHAPSPAPPSLVAPSTAGGGLSAAPPLLGGGTAAAGDPQVAAAVAATSEAEQAALLAAEAAGSQEAAAVAAALQAVLGVQQLAGGAWSAVPPLAPPSLSSSPLRAVRPAAAVRTAPPGANAAGRATAAAAGTAAVGTAAVGAALGAAPASGWAVPVPKLDGSRRRVSGAAGGSGKPAVAHAPQIADTERGSLAASRPRRSNAGRRGSQLDEDYVYFRDNDGGLLPGEQQQRSRSATPPAPLHTPAEAGAAAGIAQQGAGRPPAGEPGGQRRWDSLLALAGAEALAGGGIIGGGNGQRGRQIINSSCPPAAGRKRRRSSVATNGVDAAAAAAPGPPQGPPQQQQAKGTSGGEDSAGGRGGSASDGAAPAAASGTAPPEWPAEGSGFYDSAAGNEAVSQVRRRRRQLPPGPVVSMPLQPFAQQQQLNNASGMRQPARARQQQSGPPPPPPRPPLQQPQPQPRRRQPQAQQQQQQQAQQLAQHPLPQLPEVEWVPGRETQAWAKAAAFNGVLSLLSALNTDSAARLRVYRSLNRCLADPPSAQHFLIVQYPFLRLCCAEGDEDAARQVVEAIAGGTGTGAEEH